MSDIGKDVRVRVAPSPTGVPHVGTAYVALFNLAFAQKHDGTFVLRIEDTDRERSRRQYEKKIFEGLQWLDLNWDEGPDCGGTYGPYRQSERTDLYREHVEQLLDNGRAYECFCSEERLEKLRERQKQEGQPLGYDGRCRALSPEERKRKKENGASYVVRLRVDDDGNTSFEDRIRGEITFDHREIDDQVLLKSDGYPTYHLANVVDDHHMDISHVMRAEEWISSTAKHILLYEAFDWKPPVYAHLPLLRNKDQSKISKRENPVSILWYREQGYLPEALVNFLSLMGFSMPDESELYSFDRLVEEFSFDRMRTTAPVFDLEKLKWVNGNYIRELDEDELARKLVEGGFCEAEYEVVREAIPLIQERLKTLEDIDMFADFLFEDDVDRELEEFLDRCESYEEAHQVLTGCLDVLSSYEQFTDTDLEEKLRSLAERVDAGVGGVFMSLRIAITGKTETPPLFPCMDFIGPETVRRRISNACEELERAMTG